MQSLYDYIQIVTTLISGESGSFQYLVPLGNLGHSGTTYQNEFDIIPSKAQKLCI